MEFDRDCLKKLVEGKPSRLLQVIERGWNLHRIIKVVC
jgi:hypothetical protein